MANTAAKNKNPRAFAVWWKDMDRWDPPSFHDISWHWPSHVMCSIGEVLRPRKEKVDRKRYQFSDLQPITIHFDGTVDKRKVDSTREYTMDLWFAHPGDIVVAKIDLKNGAVCIIPNDWYNVVVTGHFAIYEPDLDRLLPEYFHLVIQSSFYKAHLWRNKVGAEGRKEVKLDFFEADKIPIPPLPVQQAIVAHWEKAQASVSEAENQLITIKQRVNDYLHSLTVMEPCERRALALSWDELESWDVKSSRAAAFKLANPGFRPLSEYAEEATELARPKLEPEKDWPVYGVNNKEGVFFSDYQKGADFNAPYKRIRKDWFFHNPTRSSVGSLGIVPDVPEDAITSPEYQVWRIRSGLLPGFVATMITTDYFIKLIQFNRVGAVKQRLYVENLLSIPIPEIPEEFQREVAYEREKALAAIAEAREKVAKAAVEVEAMILGTKKIELQGGLPS